MIGRDEVDAHPDRSDVGDALRRQRDSCRALGSPFHAAVLDVLLAEHEAGGPVAELLAGITDRPVHDALPLRLLGTLHRIVLEGRGGPLAQRYPSVGGDGTCPTIDELLDVIDAERRTVEQGLTEPVQTNEVGRASALVLGFALVGRRTGLPLRVLELGSSAGLNLWWDRFAYEIGPGHVVGDPASPVRMRDMWTTPPDLTGLTPVVERAGCDQAPIDPTDPAQAMRLLSFVWPDQTARMERLRGGISIAAAEPLRVECADAGEWLARRIATPVTGTATVVVHSIVWQYLAASTRAAVRRALEDAGRRAAPDAPLAWLRMEPAGPFADVRLTWWWPTGPEETVVATAGYHGADVVPVDPTSAPRWRG